MTSSSGHVIALDQSGASICHKRAECTTFSVNKIPVNLPKVYEECLYIYTEYSAAVEGHIQDVQHPV